MLFLSVTACMIGRRNCLILWRYCGNGNGNENESKDRCYDDMSAIGIEREREREIGGRKQFLGFKCFRLGLPDFIYLSIYQMLSRTIARRLLDTFRI